MIIFILLSKTKEGYKTNYEKMKLKHRQCLQRLQSLKSTLNTLPDGQFIFAHNGNYNKWYQSDGHHKIYIPKSNRTLAEQLALKKYLSCLIEDLSGETKALELYLRHYPNPKISEQLLSKNPAYVELLSSYFKPKSQDLLEWMNASFESNPQHPELLIHKTTSGHMVRSKSEAMIDSLLYTNRIPFRYECALDLNNLIVYPDFTIRHPETGNFYYWEHFGLMDDLSYCKKACYKLQTFISNGIIPTIQLITTYETPDNPLSTDLIQKTIEHYFL